MSTTKKKQNYMTVKETPFSPEDIKRARERQKLQGGAITKNLVRTGAVSDIAMSKVLAKSHNVSAIDLDSFEIPNDVLEILGVDTCRKLKVIPVSKFGNRLVVAFANPNDHSAIADLGQITRFKIEVVFASLEAITAAIEKYYPEASKLQKSITQMEDSSGQNGLSMPANSSRLQAVEINDSDGSTDEPIIVLVNQIIVDAIKRKASDIHVEPFENSLRIRFRVDGTLLEVATPPNEATAAIISRFKIISQMDISEKRRPQDGRIRIKLKNKPPVDFRVNSIPTMHGESIVLRLLDKSNLQQEVESLGFDDKQMGMVQSALLQPQGMILVTGPTGSGKTTTLYSFIKKLNTPNRKILTAENPVEFNLEGIVQTQIRSEINYNFSDALRAFLRQDPEIIMLGEIRDLETAEIAYKAAATGHLVLSTLHTNDAASTISRLLDMKLPPYVVSESTSLIIAQRLIKLVCKKCKVPHEVNEKVLLQLGIPREELSDYKEIYKGTGCTHCNQTGLSGRAPIFEILKVTAAVQESITRGDPPLRIKKEAMEKAGMITLRKSALAKLKLGVTTVEQVLVSSIDDDI